MFRKSPEKKLNSHLGLASFPVLVCFPSFQVSPESSLSVNHWHKKFILRLFQGNLTKDSRRQHKNAWRIAGSLHWWSIKCSQNGGRGRWKGERSQRMMKFGQWSIKASTFIHTQRLNFNTYKVFAWVGRRKITQTMTLYCKESTFPIDSK